MIPERVIPGMDTDHICRLRRCVNPAHLQQVTRSQNNQNHSGAQINSRSGHRGVWWSEREKKWCVQVKLNYKRYSGGYNSELSDAVEAAKALRIKLMSNNLIDRAGVR